MMGTYAESGDARGTIMGHPKGLFVLFFAEMWERFSYYGMRALLIFYLTQHWLYSDGESGVIYGAYTALVYITPVLGGYLADRWLGQRKAVLFGAVLLTFGHFLMGFEGSTAGGHENNPALNVFWLALAFIIVGSGFLKANISVIVGQLYPRTDVRRDGAYTIFYVGINLGAALGSLAVPQKAVDLVYQQDGVVPLGAAEAIRDVLFSLADKHRQEVGGAAHEKWPVELCRQPAAIGRLAGAWWAVEAKPP